MIRQKQIYIILTEEASLEEIIKTQEELLKLGIRLTVNHAQYNVENTRIEKITAEFKAEGNTSVVSWNKNNDKYNFLVFGSNRNTKESFSGQGRKLLKKIKVDDAKSKLFILGRENSQETINYLEKQLGVKKKPFQKNIKNPNWKGKLSKSATYSNLTKDKIKQIKANIQKANPSLIYYQVDGISWNENALNIPTEQIEQIIWTEKNLIKYNEQGEISSENVERLEIIITRKTKQKKPKAKKGYQYFKECDCHIPKIFNPANGNNKFKIEGGKNK